MPDHADATHRTVTIDGANLHVTTSGDSGPAVLLLHGFPQTQLAWRGVAPALADSFQVVAPDLPGYGASDAPAGDDPTAYAKRRTATTMVELMHRLGHERFAVIGHDRGALVALRARLDHPGAMTHVGALDIIPNVDNWAALSGVAGVFAFHLYLLAQPTDLPERMIGAEPDIFFGHFLDTWVTQPGAISADARAAYLAAAAALMRSTRSARTTGPAPSSTPSTMPPTSTPDDDSSCPPWPCGRTPATHRCPSTRSRSGGVGPPCCARRCCRVGTSCPRNNPTM